MREQRWVLALVGRCLSYGAGMGLYFFFACLVVSVFLGVTLGLLVSIPALFISWLDGWSVDNLYEFSGAFGLVLGTGSAAVGAVGGVIAGFNSPRDDKNSAYFSAVFGSGSRWLCYGLLSGLASGAALGIVLWLFLTDASWGLAPILPLGWLGQGYGLWRGINAARRRLPMNVVVGADSPDLESADG